MTFRSQIRRGKRLLVASIGVATVTYASAQSSGCTDDLATRDKLVAPPPHDANASDAGVDGSIPNTGNLLPPPPDPSEMDAGGDADGGDVHMIPTGNLMPPPPATENE